MGLCFRCLKMYDFQFLVYQLCKFAYLAHQTTYFFEVNTQISLEECQVGYIILKRLMIIAAIGGKVVSHNRDRHPITCSVLMIAKQILN